MKIKGRICDICGNDVCGRGCTDYIIIKKDWIDLFGSRVDICGECWGKIKDIITEKKGGTDYAT